MTAPPGVAIRPGRADEWDALATLATDAAPAASNAPDWRPRLSACQAEGMLWVAADEADRPVGFAAGTVADDNLHIVALAVARARQGRGIGRALLEQAIDHGRWAFFPAVTATAGAAAPLHRRLGFMALRSDRLPPDLAAFLRVERDAWADSERIALAKVL